MVEFFGGTPADVVMFGSGEGKGAVPGPRPVDHADMFVSVGDAVDIEKARGQESASARAGGGRAFAEQFDVEAAFFFGLAERGSFGVFIQFDVAAEWQPFVEVAMVDEEDFGVLDDKDGDGEIDFFVNVGHKRAGEV